VDQLRRARESSADERHVGAERPIDSQGTAIPGQQLQAMVHGSSSDECVVHGPARDAQSSEVPAQAGRCRFAKETGSTKVVLEKDEHVAGERRAPGGSRVSTE